MYIDEPHLRYVDWKRDPGLRKLYFWAFILCIASATTGYDASMLNNLRMLHRFNDYFGNPTGSTLGLLTALYSIGSIISLPVVPFVADHMGRKAAIALGCTVMITGAIVQGTATTLTNFMAGRSLMGFGNSLAQLSSPLLLTELCHPQHRARVTATYNCLWYSGAIVCTWLTFGTKRLDSNWSWRVPALGQALPSIVQLLFIFFIPESPRWLVARGRNQEALNILGKYHANGDINDPAVQYEFHEIRETLQIEFQYQTSSSYLDFFRTPGNRYRLLLLASLGLFSQWSGNGLVSYYATDVYNSIGIRDADMQLGMNGGITVMSLIVSVSCSLLVDRVGRRPLFIAATASMCTCFIVWTVASSIQEEKHSIPAGRAVIAFIWIFQFCYSVAWTGLLVAYTVEILPFKIRAKGLMIMNVFIQVALTINQYVNPLGFLHLKPAWKLYTIYAVWVFLELIFVCFMYIETRGPTLEEIAKIIDGDEAKIVPADIVHLHQRVSFPGLDKDHTVRYEDIKLQQLQSSTSG
ncbi:general substrate transporter [Paraphaeosphaeria sporulosa]|uniref:General substrate transporter n=1 Tax=Paraphaeosphaeria sporulosa TaxID=1460663 RepID=A0A177C918_9PLEO|nr:general substrate transporter [Paraphaeosphaeria sporulosa]OAG03352.1 general substrate transporter [Paraphaeosphaeria sporulosa]